MPESVSPQRIDLVNPAATFVNRLPDMTAFRERFFRACRTRVFQALRRSLQVGNERWAVIPHDEYLTQVHSDQCLYGITELPPVRGLSIVTVSRGLLSAVVDDLFGAGDIPTDPADTTDEISAMERRIGLKLLGMFVQSLRDAFAPQIDIAPRLVRTESHTTLASVADAEEPLCMMAANVAMQTGGGLLSVAIPYRGLEPYRLILASSTSGLALTKTNQAWFEQIAAMLDRVPIEVAVAAGVIRIPVREMRRLKVGDVIPFRLFKQARIVSPDGTLLCVAEAGARNGEVHLRLQQKGDLMG